MTGPQALKGQAPRQKLWWKRFRCPVKTAPESHPDDDRSRSRPTSATRRRWQSAGRTVARGARDARPAELTHEEWLTLEMLRLALQGLANCAAVLLAELQRHALRRGIRLHQHPSGLRAGSGRHGGVAKNLSAPAWRLRGPARSDPREARTAGRARHPPAQACAPRHPRRVAIAAQHGRFGARGRVGPADESF